MRSGGAARTDPGRALAARVRFSQNHRIQKWGLLPINTTFTPTAAGTYTAITTAPYGCTSTSNAVNIYANPTAYSVTGGGSLCTGGTGVAVGLANSQSGVNYQLQLGGSNTGSAVAGTSAAIPFGNKTAAGTYSVVATNADGCTANMTGSASVTVNASPTAYAVTGGGSLCTGGTGAAVGLDNSETGVNYQLQLGGSNTGSPMAGSTGAAIDFGNQMSAGTYTVVATQASGGCTATMTGAATVSINSPLSTTLTTTNGSCLGANDLTLSGASTATQIEWQLGGSTVATTLPLTATIGTTVAGGNGNGSAANQLYSPIGIFVDASGNTFVADFLNHRIQKWAPGASTGTTVAGGNASGRDRKSTRLNSSHLARSRMPSSA